MSKCENCKKYDDCRDGSGLTWPCGAYRPIIGELLPEELQEIAQAKAEGRLVVLKASISQDVWFYDGANRLMQGKVLEYLNCGNGLIYQVQGAKKGLWLHEHEIFLSQKEALLAVAKNRKRR